MNYKAHWEKVYQTKSPNEVSWTQAIPKTSLDFISSLRIDKHAEIIDIGGGDSLLVDHLLALGYENISVLDISAKALERAKERLGDKAAQVTWIVSDVLHFQPTTRYDVWHDRAAFHFLNTPEEIASYTDVVNNYVGGHLIIATFSEDGPQRCSGLDIQQYSTRTMKETFHDYFSLITSCKEDHLTPFNTVQNFLFCSFKKQ